MESRPSVESLLAHRSWVRALALALVGDEAGADDVTQETWLRSMRHPPRGDDGLKAWLYRVVRSVVLDWRRSEGRRSARERLAARGEATVSTEALVEQADLQRAVAAAVCELEEPYRETLLLHYFEGLPPRGVAARMGVPVETVRTRLKRGHDMLRGRLDRECGSRAKWMPAMILIASSPRPGMGLGVLAMSTKTKMAGLAALLLLLCAGFLWYGGMGSRADQGRASSRPRDVAGTAEAAGDGSSRLATSSADVTGAPGDGEGWTVRGRVSLGLTKPYPNARVRVLVFAGYDTEGPARSQDVAIADERGRFRWSMPAPRETLTVQFSSADENAFSMTTGLRAIPGGRSPGPVDFWVLPHDCRVVGTVRDSDGRLLPDAEVRTSWSKAWTPCDARGGYVLPASSYSSDGITVTARAPGFAIQRGTGRVEGPGEEARVDLVLEREFRIVGRVTNEEGVPVPDAVAKTFETSFVNEARTDADGNFRLGGLDRSRPRHSLFVRHRDFVETRIDLSTSGDEVKQDVVLKRGVRVRGRVLDDRGEPVLGAGIFLGNSTAAYDRLDATSLDDGEFVFPCVPPGSHTMVTQRQGRAPDLRILEVPRDVREVDGIVIELGPPHVIAGKVVDSAGSPLEGVWVSAELRPQFFLDGNRQTGEDGSFRLEDLPAHPVKLSLYSSNGFLRLDLPQAQVDREDYVFVLQRAAGLSGRVIDRDTGQPVRRFTIRFIEPTLQPGERRGWGYSAKWARQGQQFDDPQGTWRTERQDLEPGTVFGIEAIAEGYAPGRNLHVVASVVPDPDAGVVKLAPGVTVAGRVLGPDGAPVVAALVTLFDPEHPPRPYDSDEAFGRPRGRTGADGTFEIEHVNGGTWSLTVEHAEYPTRLDGPFSAPGDPREIRLERGGRIAGIVGNSRGEPLARARVRVSALGVAGRSVTAATDSAGRFVIDGLGSGTYRVAHVETRQPVGEAEIFSRAFVLKAPDEISVQLLPRGSASVSGSIECDGTLPAEVVVALTPIDDRPQEEHPPSLATLAKDGRFELRGAEPGKYRLVASHHMVQGRYLMAHQEIELAEGEAEVVALKLR